MSDLISILAEINFSPSYGNGWNSYKLRSFTLFGPTVPFYRVFFYLGFTHCMAEHPLQGIGLQEKEHENNENYIGQLYRKNPEIRNVY